MALVLADRVQESSTSTGTGTFTLAGAAAGFVSFSVIGNGNTTYYCITNPGTSEWEVGIGTYTSSGTTLARTTVLSNYLGTTALVNFSSGSKSVFVTYPSSRSVNLDQSTSTANAPQFNATNGLFVNSLTVSSNYTIPVGYSASSVGPVTVNSGITVTVSSGSRWVVV
jgi:hypothetical protein